MKTNIMKKFVITGKYRGITNNICYLWYKTPNGIPEFHDSFNYDYHFIIKELAEELEERFKCLIESTEKNSYEYALHESKKKMKTVRQ